MAAEIDPTRPLIAGKYRLTQLLGRGGMGSVWEGVHTTLGTRVAVKFIDAEHVNSGEARSRFETEARAAARLRSKYVVEVYDHGVSDDGRPFIVMEYLQGEPLDRRLDRLGRLPAKQTALILQQVCRALAKAHAANIVHRDLKPENVFLVWDDEDGADVAKVVDFGIAKFTDGSLGPSSATRTGSVLGTPYYMSPEQARGLRSVDYRTDLWSLGIIAYRCIVGALPFEGEAIGDLLVKLCTAPIPIPSQIVADVPPGFDAFIARALARDPTERFQSSQELAASLCAVCGISVRSAYGTGEAPQYSDANATGPHPARAEARRAAALTEPSIPNVADAGATGAPLSQTSPTASPASHGTRALLALAALVLVGGGVVGYGALSSKATVTGDSRGPDSVLAVAANPLPTLAPTPSAQPDVVPLASPVPQVTASAAVLASPSAAASAISAPRSHSSAARGPAVPPPVSRPHAVTARPTPPVAVSPPSKPLAAKPASTEIDVGY